jgi:RNA-directed DNA polymerase
MPSRSFFIVPDQLANKRIALDYSPDFASELMDFYLNRNIAPLGDEGSISALLGISTKTIFNIIVKKDKHYRSFFISNKSGSKRRIDSPRTYLKVIQWWINDNILSNISYPDYISAFCSGRGPLYNAKIHEGNRHILNIDLRDFFPSIKKEQVLSAFRTLGYNDIVSSQLAELTTYNDQLPQGAPTSPYLANLIAGNMDVRLLKYCYENGLTYSRYADDITISSVNKIEKNVVSILDDYVRESGFLVNKKKTRFSGPGQRIEVTGITINEKLQPARYKRKQYRAAFHNASKLVTLSKPERDKLSGYVGALLSMGLTEAHPLVCEGKAVLKIPLA